MDNFSFKLWLEELFQWGDEFSPPEGHNGPGLICFDFDKTLTTGFRVGKRMASTIYPNREIIAKAEKHKSLGNHCVIVTGRGTEVDKNQDSMTFPSISVYDAMKQWRLGDLFDEIIMTGGVNHNDMEDKAGKIFYLMKKYHSTWAVLYDDLRHNIDHINDMAKKGIAIRGILVTPRETV